MRKLKPIFAFILSGILAAVLLAGCSGTPAAEDAVNSSPEAPATQPSEPETSDEPADSGEPAAATSEAGPETVTAEGGKTLVVYFSASGNTETVAGYIAKALSADIFEIVPAEPYTNEDLDWTDSDSRVSREHDDPSLRVMELTETAVDGWDSYDTVLIGYPIWWGIAAWPVDNFVRANDFTGKTVIPFCTSSSSGLGESGELLAELAGTGEWQDGQRFRGRAAESDITEWLDGLNLSD